MFILINKRKYPFVNFNDIHNNIPDVIIEMESPFIRNGNQTQSILFKFKINDQKDHSTMETALVKKNVPKVWSTPSFKALKNVNIFDFR